MVTHHRRTPVRGPSQAVHATNARAAMTRSIVSWADGSVSTASSR